MLNRHGIMGLPPRMRGKPAFLWAISAKVRITPAYAGKTGFCTCGAACTGGSPPWMRGKLCYFFIFVLGIRITPADAGKTSVFRARMGRQSDHPRGCGENLPALCTPRQQGGSPPRMRGKLPDFGGFSDEPGITPADAGKTRRLPWRLGF